MSVGAEAEFGLLEAVSATRGADLAGRAGLRCCYAGPVACSRSELGRRRPLPNSSMRLAFSINIQATCQVTAGGSSNVDDTLRPWCCCHVPSLLQDARRSDGYLQVRIILGWY